GQQRANPLGDVHDLHADGHVRAHPQSVALREVPAGPVALQAARHGSAGDAALLAHLDDGRVKGPAVPLLRAADVDGHRLGIRFDLHVTSLVLAASGPAPLQCCSAARAIRSTAAGPSRPLFTVTWYSSGSDQSAPKDAS